MAQAATIAERLATAMAQPEFYSPRPEAVEVRETHISRVFLAGDFVYKLKKPVHYPFVDYSTLAQRFHFCGEEVRLNRRLAPQVYLGVIPIVASGGGFTLGAASEEPAAEAIEYAVKMRRLPEDRSLEHIARAGTLGRGIPTQIARVIAHFHRKAACDRALRYGSAAAIEKSIMENLGECRPFVGDTIGEAQLGELLELNRHFITSHREALDARARDGHVREGHGDLRCEHVYVGDQIEIVDCVEFNEALRYGDVASDLAFLISDLERCAAAPAGHELLREYLAVSGDGGLPALLNFYKCYRAVVRGKVATLKSREPNLAAQEHRRNVERARERFAAALGYARLLAPALIAICGLPGTGKTTIAQVLSERTGFAHYNSDVVRKAMHGLSPQSRAAARWGEGIYDPAASRATYERLRQSAADELAAGKAAIVDASFKDAGERERLQEVARRAGAPIIFAQCAIDEEVLRRRLAERAARQGSVSDATWEIYLQQKKEFAPFGPQSKRYHLMIDSGGDPVAAAIEIERFLTDRAMV